MARRIFLERLKTNLKSFQLHLQSTGPDWLEESVVDDIEKLRGN